MIDTRCVFCRATPAECDHCRERNDRLAVYFDSWAEAFRKGAGR